MAPGAALHGTSPKNWSGSTDIVVGTAPVADAVSSSEHDVASPPMAVRRQINDAARATIFKRLLLAEPTPLGQALSSEGGVREALHIHWTGISTERARGGETATSLSWRKAKVVLLAPMSLVG